MVFFKNAASQDMLRMKDYKYLSWVYGVDRKICHEGHCDAEQ